MVKEFLLEKIQICHDTRKWVIVAHSQRKRKRENHRRREHQNILPRNGYTPRIWWTDELRAIDDMENDAWLKGIDDYVSRAEMTEYRLPAFYVAQKIAETLESDVLWRQANPILGEVVKDDG